MKTPAPLVSLVLLLSSLSLSAQQSYFADGYHGGIFGHYPMWKTQFIVDKLSEHPEWRINMEIEPETWDSVRVNTPDAYRAFQQIVYDPWLEFTNPTYAQPYAYNTSGESLIRQFEYGMKKHWEHFPGLTFDTYCAEEPCFTSAMPQILRSFGFRYAVLKNPDTCWGGYTRAYGTGKVNWIGPDGTSIPTIPRYSCEELEENSTWQTTAWNNSDKYLKACSDAGVKYPIGMCYQDAGWRNGPWIGSGNKIKNNSQYLVWRDYFEQINPEPSDDDWHLSQEDILVSLMWGSQVMQGIGRQVRSAENKIVDAEKVVAMAAVEKDMMVDERDWERAWRTLLLAQHHDSWIVPYNRLTPSHSWAQEIAVWTAATEAISDSLIASADALLTEVGTDELSFRVYNTQPQARREVIRLELSEDNQQKDWKVLSVRGKVLPSVKRLVNGQQLLFCEVEVPPTGYTSIRLKPGKPGQVHQPGIVINPKGYCTITTDDYRMELDARRGGVITSLKDRRNKDKELVDNKQEIAFNEVKGYFYEQEAWLSSAEAHAQILPLIDNDLCKQVEIRGTIGEHPFVQTITLTKGSERIDFTLFVDWQGNPGIGEYRQGDNWRDNRRAFYDDRYKLSIYFPLALTERKVYKNAPFDVCESHLEHTHFNTWDSIKHNIILNWVDVTDSRNTHGVALFSDHTTSYSHGKDHPLALTAQYSGHGLWGMNYRITEPLRMNYALLPHEGSWKEAEIDRQSREWNSPLIVKQHQKAALKEQSFVQFAQDGFDLSMLKAVGDRQLLLRVFNAGSKSDRLDITFGFPVESIEEVELNGQSIAFHPVQKKKRVRLSVPQFGIRTYRITLP